MKNIMSVFLEKPYKVFQYFRLHESFCKWLFWMGSVVVDLT